MPNIPRADLVRAAWGRGLLSYKLHPDQRLVDSILSKSTSLLKTIRISRKWGKSVYLLAKGAEAALQYPGERINYAAQTNKILQEVLFPLARIIFADAPEDMRPRIDKQRGYINFTNEATIVLAGCEHEDAMERLRGPSARRSIVDESGAIPGLRYLVTDILKPQHLLTGGDILLGGTPPKSTDHPFVTWCLDAEASGAGVRRTLYDNPMLTPEQIQAWVAESARNAGMTVEDYLLSPSYRREYLAEFIGDPEKLVFPSFTEEKAALLVRELAPPPFRDCYVSMDVGHREDWTGLLFAYWHYPEATLVIEDELVIRRMTTPELAQGVRAKEFALWGNGKPYRRVSDIASQLTADLSQLHGLDFVDTSKDDKDAAINQVAMAINGQRGRLAIHPRCVNLVRQLKQCTWNRARTSFERTETNGHYDLVDSLIYLVRNIQRNHNPFPEGYGADMATHHIHRPPPSMVQSLRGAFNTKRILGGGFRGGNDD